MKRPGFYLPVIAVFVFLSMLVLGILIERVTASARTSCQPVQTSQPASAFRGLKMAEDWLLSSVLEGDFPSARGYGVSLDLIEALRSDGGRAEWAGALDGEKITVYVADVSCDRAVFGGEFANKAGTPSIPRIPGVCSEDAVLRYYYIRGSAQTRNSPVFDCEEVLSCRLDKISGVLEVRRIFYRSSMRNGRSASL
jgi:hypothetical protein